MELIESQAKLVPDMVEIMERRYDILKSIYFNEPIGRRSLSSLLDISERIVRSEVSLLKDTGLISIETMGMYISDEGKGILTDLEGLMNNLKGLSELETQLEGILGVKKIIVVKGDLEKSKETVKVLGNKSAAFIKSQIRDGMTIGVTGGNTIFNMVGEMKEEKVKRDVVVTPARGGLGKDLKIQSNNIAALLASKLGGNYKLLHVPDNIDLDTLNAIKKIPVIEDVLDIIEHIDMLIFGIGRFDDMAKRRELPEDMIDKLEDAGAVSEAFGHYFNLYGEQVWESLTIGLTLEDFKKIPNAIAIAGGKDKAEAIISILSVRKDITLITDEGAAREIVSLV